MRKRWAVMSLIGVLSCATPLTASAPTLGAACEPSADYERHDVGLVWLDARGCEARAGHFESLRPTIVFVHGWQRGSVAGGYVPSLQDARYGVRESLGRDWVRRGFNVGIFRWTQLADEDEVQDAEAKIWTAKGPRAMRWRKADGTYGRRGAEVGVGRMLARAVRRAMPKDSGPLWIAGHSLGNQVAVRAAADLMDAGVGVERVVLLDPFWSKGPKAYLGGKSTGARVVELMERLSRGRTTLELYKTSNLNDLGLGDPNEPARRLATYYDVWPDYLFPVDQKGRHDVSIFYYFATQTAAPRACDDASRMLGARATPETLTRPEAGTWTQRRGRHTFDPSDDCYAFSPM